MAAPARLASLSTRNWTRTLRGPGKDAINYARKRLGQLGTHRRGPQKRRSMPSAERQRAFRSEIFRSEGAPQDSVDLLFVDRVVELRGRSSGPRTSKKSKHQARAIAEVRDVKNMLHLPKVPAPGRVDSPGRQKRR